MRWAPGLGRGLVVECVLQGRFPGCGQAPCGAVGHPFAARGGMECCDRLRSDGVNQTRIRE